MEKGKVYLVGAGPGDGELLTIKGLKCLRQADVIVYDYLASGSLLNEANENAELIYAGKQSGQHSMSQVRIQELLVEKAMEGKCVVRLKGGDPFIFGRGGEEALALEAAEIPYEVVPGVSSAYSVPAYAGIPVTHRGLASQVHFITGHEQPGGLGLNYAHLSKEEGTLVFLMGIRRLGEIKDSLIGNGKDPKTPAAVIMKGTTGAQKEVIATLETIVSEAAKADVRPPGILVVGSVVSLAERIGQRKEKRLSGKRILLTGTKELVRKQYQSLLKEGGDPLAMSLIYTEPAEEEMMADVFKRIGTFSWVVFTSSNGVSIFFDVLRKFGVDYRKLCSLKFAVVGAGTGETLKHYGFSADYMPPIYTSEALAEGLAVRVGKDERVLVFRAKEGSEILNVCFEKAGILYEDFAAYTTRVDWRKKDILERTLVETDYITFASGSAVKAFKEMTEGIEVLPEIVCIGPVTAASAEAAGFKIRAVAEEYTVEGLTKCLCRINIRE